MTQEKVATQATHSHVDGLVARLRAKAEQLEQVKEEGNLYKMALASMEVQNCCSDCITVTCIPCCGCIAINASL
jgi:hypothetical protein